MGKHLLTDEEWGRNVGTGNYPVTFLHEYAVGLIWDMLEARFDGLFDAQGLPARGGKGRPDGVLQLPVLGGGMSGDVLDGVERPVIPDDLQPVGGYIPDIALIDGNLKVIRVIEVVVTSEPSPEKLMNLESRGVEVVRVPVRNELELRALFPEPLGEKVRWWTKRRKGDGIGLGVNFRSSSKPQYEADKKLDELMRTLVTASPEKRRQFVVFLQEMDSLESLYPLRGDNPKRGVVSS